MLLRGRSGAWAALVLSIVVVFVALRAATGNPREPAVQTTLHGDSESRFERPKEIPFPEDNQYSEARAALGKALFFDPRLSKSRFFACSSCHNPGLAWGDGNPLGTGNAMQALGRRTPTILNVAWAAALFWDGRSETLEEQATIPIAGPGEMNLSVDSVAKRLAAIPGYRRLFEDAYPREGITPATLAKALATYERTVVSGTAPFDRWVSGDASAISTEAASGFALFTGKANCSKCHSGWRFTDDSFHDTGVPGTDSGRGRIVDLEVIQFAFKTPTLRNVHQRGPYMHAGSEATLEDVVDLYDLGGRVRRPSLSAEITPLHLTATERRALVAFLKTLTSEDAPVIMPVLPR